MDVGTESPDEGLIECIRVAEVGDANDIAHLMEDCGKRLETLGRWNDWPSPYPVGYLESTLTSTEYTVLVCTDDRRPACGSVTIRWTKDKYWSNDDHSSAYLHRLVVAPDCWGRGIGTRLLNAAARIVDSRGRETLRIDFPNQRRDLIRYYEAKGFVLAGQYHSDTYSAYLAEAATKDLLRTEE